MDAHRPNRPGVSGADTPHPGEPFATPAQRDALTSPVRLEILGLFTAPGPLSVRELAERMGRSASSVHYHVNLMVEVGLLRDAGTRPRGTRSETVYEPARRTVRFRGTPHPGEADATLRTMAAAFRMAERDLEAALRPPPEPAPGSLGEAPAERSDEATPKGPKGPKGPEEPARGAGEAPGAGGRGGREAPPGEGAGLLATRIHFRADADVLAEVRGHLRAVLDLLRRQAGRAEPPAPSEGVYSLTLALLPLRGRSLD